MSGYSNPFRYIFKEPYKSITCIYKLWFGTKYLIWKSKALHQGVNQASVELDRRMRLGYDQTSMWYKALNHIKSGRVTIMTVEVIHATDDPSELLIEEYKQLLAAKEDPKCLNMSFEPYVANWIPVEARQALEKYKAEIEKKTAKKSKIQKAGIKTLKKVLNAKRKPKATSKSSNVKAGAKRRGGRK